MSRQIFHRYLLFYLSVSAILVCGLSRRIPRGASCPSCSQDCPEALTVQLPWYPEQESNLQPQVLQDFPVNSLQNSLRPRLIKEGTSQDITYDNNILPSQNTASLENYKSFSPQKSASENLLFKNLINNFPKYIDRREIFSQDKSAIRYPLARVLPLRQIFKPENIFRNPRNKYSSSSLEDRSFENNITDKKEATNKIYRADRDTEPLNSNNVSSSNVIWPQKFKPKIENTFQFRPDFRISDGKRNAITKSLSPVAQQYNLMYPRKRYNSVDFVLPELKRDSYVHPLKDINIWKPIKNDEFSDNRDNKIEYPSQSLNLGQLKQAENNFLEMFPAKEQEIITEDNSVQINKSYVLPQNLDTWKLTDNGESLDDWDYTAHKDSQEFVKINRLQEAENNWLQMSPAMKKNGKYFENEKDKEFAEQENINQEYFEDEIVQDALEIEQRRHPYDFPQNMNWETTQDKELFDNLDYTHKNLQQTDQLKIYSEENNDRFFQNKGNENIILETQANDGQINSAPMLNAYNTYNLPQYLNILNNAKYPVDFLDMQEIPEVKNNILHANPTEESDERFLANEDIIQNNAPIQDLYLSKYIFDMDEYSNHVIDKENKDNTQVLTRLDPDLLDDIEDLPLEPTESTSIESLAEFSTSEQ